MLRPLESLLELLPLLLLLEESEVSAPGVADATAFVPVITLLWIGDGLKSPLVGAAVLVVPTIAAALELDVGSSVAPSEVAGAFEVVVGSALVGSVGSAAVVFVVLVWLGVGASLVGAELPTITCQS